MNKQSQSNETSLRNSVLFYAAICALISTIAFLVGLSVDIYLVLSLIFDYSDTNIDWSHLSRVNLLAVIGMYYNIVFYEAVEDI